MSKLEQYKLCQQRGHQPSKIILTCHPPLNICKHCGTSYRFEKRLIEQNPPAEGKS